MIELISIFFPFNIDKTYIEITYKMLENNISLFLLENEYS